MDLIGALCSLDVHEALDAVTHGFLGSVKLRRIGLETWHLDLIAQIILHRERQNEVTVGQADRKSVV